MDQHKDLFGSANCFIDRRILGMVRRHLLAIRGGSYTTTGVTVYYVEVRGPCTGRWVWFAMFTTQALMYKFMNLAFLRWGVRLLPCVH